MKKIKEIISKLCWRYLAKNIGPAKSIERLCVLYPNEHNALVLFGSDGRQIMGIEGIKINQSLVLMKSGYAEVELKLFVAVQKPKAKTPLTKDKLKELLKPNPKL